MNSFNVYGQTSETIGGHTPVWLGTVKPIPRGVKISVRKGEIIKAGYAVIYTPQEKSVTFVTDLTSPLVNQVNAFIYNDVICTEDGSNPDGSTDATCALVMHHPEGLLIERVYPDITEEQIAALQTNIPGVLLVRG